MAYSSWSVVFGEQPSAAKWNILGTNDAGFNDGTGIAVSAITPEKLLTGTGTSWPWAAYTPTFANTTLGNGTVSGKYKQIGKTVSFYAIFTLGSSSAVGTAATVTLPVTSVTLIDQQPIGAADFFDTSAGQLFSGQIRWATTTTLRILLSTVVGGAGTYVRMDSTTSTTPFTWATGDILFVQGNYEAA